MSNNENITKDKITKKHKEKKPKKVLTKKQKVFRACGYGLLLALVVVFFINVVFLPLTSDNQRVDSINSYSGQNPFIVFDKHQQVAAHRAGAILAPEETMKAFKTSVSNGSDIVEFDLHMTKDGEVVLLHDHELDRTSNAATVLGKEKLEVKDCTLAQLEKVNFAYNFKDKDGNFPYRNITEPSEIKANDIGIARLDDVLRYLKNNASPNLNYIIEIKDNGDNGKKIADYLMNKLVEYDIFDKVAFGTFKGDITKYVDEKWPELNRSASILEALNFYFAFLYGTKPPVNCEVLQIPVGWGIYDLSSKAFIDYAHHYNIAVQYWTINDADVAKRLLKNGADAIITDNPELIKSIMN